MEINIPIRQKQEYTLDNGMVIEKWEKIAERKFTVDPNRVPEEQIKAIENGPDVMWWGVAQLPVPGPNGVEAMPINFRIDATDVVDAAGKFEESLNATLDELKKEQSKIQTPNAQEVQAFEAIQKSHAAEQKSSGGIIV